MDSNKLDADGGCVGICKIYHKRLGLSKGIHSILSLGYSPNLPLLEHASTFIVDVILMSFYFRCFEHFYGCAFSARSLH
jgi:hypothetical protein